MDRVDKYMAAACLSGAAAGILYADCRLICTPIVLGIVAAGSVGKAIAEYKRDRTKEEHYGCR